MYWNKELYRIDISGEEFQSKLEKLIDIQEENRIQNHIFKDVRRTDEIIRGELKKNEFTMWRTNRRWNGIFYPVFKGEIREINETRLIEIKTRFNPFAELIVLILTLGLVYGIISEIVIQTNNELKHLLMRGIVGILLLLIFQSVPIISYYNLKNQTLKGLQDYFGLTKVKLKKRKQR